MATAEEWRSRAVLEIQALLEREGAVTQPEMEAKISDPPQVNVRTTGRPQPHHLTTARNWMLGAGVIETSNEATRGGKSVRTFVLSPGSTRSDRAAARKRLLHRRFLSWSDPDSEWKPPPVPSALEWVVNASLMAAAPTGYRPIRSGGGEVSVLFNEPIPGGSMDNAAWFTGLDAAGYPLPAVLALVEAKNIRGWIYAGTQEMYQLLSKSAALQVAHQSQRFVPILVCRQAHYLTHVMAKQMGFYVISTWRQYVRPVVAGDHEGRRLFDEVNTELGYNLELHDGVVEPMVRHFTHLLPARVLDSAERWAAVCAHPEVPSLLSQLRQENAKWDERREVLTQLGEAVEDVTGQDAKWKPLADGDDEPEWGVEDANDD